MTAVFDVVNPATEEIVTTVRGLGLNPLARPERRGDYYVVRAADANGGEMRVVADAKSGDVISIAPVQAFASAYAVSYGSGPRIIHVPQNYDSRVSARSEEPSRARARVEEPARAPVEAPPVDEPRTEAAPDTEAAPYDNAAADPYGRPGDMDSAPRQPAQPVQSWEQHRRPFNAAPAPQPRANVRERFSSSEGPTPVKPTPRFDQRDSQSASADADAAEQAPRRPVRRIEIPRAAPRD